MDVKECSEWVWDTPVMVGDTDVVVMALGTSVGSEEVVGS